MTGPTGLHPRSVTPGIENHSHDGKDPKVLPDGVYCRLDWIRFTGPDHAFDRLTAFLDQRFGPSTGSNQGAKFFKQGLLWEPGVMLSSGHKAGILMLDIQGQRLSTLSGMAGIEILRQLAEMHFKATRIDGAIDFIGQGVDLYRHAVASCERRELCGPRTYAPDPEYRADGTVTRRLLKLGKRDSSIAVRIYDKGLETKSANLGHWERLEVEFKDGRAQSLVHHLCHATDPIAELASRTVGAFDFRIDNGRTEKQRRPRASWWAALISDLHPIEPPPQQNISSLETWLVWFAECVAPRLLQFAHTASIPLGELVEMLTQHAKRRTKQDAVSMEFARMIQDGTLMQLLRTTLNCREDAMR